ncbi:type II secretion system protein E [Lujinxingia litoralis]|uniref:Type II secretion system protein E n=1 Tax=Lujinxingia litoralis TaxID=2211119 RepID=A0A328CDT2_9DELT|nr:GspE/PulE family protein [Lujinxingia litoralis]RAL24903.1 type II secretion system protein E [Lujinxingia litoralis]
MVGPTSFVDYSVRHLAHALLGQGLLSREQAQRAVEQEGALRQALLKEKAGHGGRRRAGYKVTPAEVIARLEFRQPGGDLLDEDAIMAALASDAGLPFEKPDPLELDMELIARTMSRPFAQRHSCVALRREDGRTVIAVDNPYDRQLLHELHTLIPGELSIVVSPKSDILRIVTEVYGLRSSISAAQEELSIGMDLGNLEQLIRLKDVGDIEATDRPIVNAVEYLLHYAFDQRASDIHLEPKRDRTVVRLRIDGVLHGVYEFPRAIHAALISRVKMLARMDIAEKRRPQDGRIKTERGGREIELRVSTLPVAFGEKAVIRVFDPQALIQSLDHIGFYHDDLVRWRDFINRPHGLILVTGPTGSGKTTTLYSTLRELAGPDVNITTVEDPIEMVYEEFNQVLVQRRIDVDFSTALRTILRQDPDIIMVGEIRDAATAAMATQAALTGHMVLSTLHTNDTPSAVSRLIDMDVEPFLMASTMVGVMAQRLLRTICPRCKVRGELSAEQVELLQIKLPPRSQTTLPMWYGQGCVKCRGTGYYGRTAIFELLSVDESVRQLIARRASAPEIRKAARANGMMSLRECAIKKLAQGLTTFEEVMTVVSDAT